MRSIAGGEIVAQMLKAEGVELVFGIIDGTYFGLYANLAKHGIRLVTPRHETSAAHMAGAYARLTGRLGVCIASNGPGVANILPGVAVENAEGNPVLLITSCRRSGIAYPDRVGTFQYFDQVAVTRPMCKWSVAIMQRERIPELMRQALRISHRGRPGVVHVDVPESILNGKDRFDPATLTGPERYRSALPLEPPPASVRQAAEMLRTARHPIIQAGSGVVHAAAFELLAEIADLLAAPVTTSWGARAALIESHRSAIPMVYLKLNDKVRKAADLVLALGTRFGETDWWGRPPHWAGPDEQRTIQVDHDPDSLGANRPIDLAVVSDLRRFLEELLGVLQELPLPPNRAERDQLLQTYADDRVSERLELDKKLKARNGGIPSGSVPRICQEELPEDTLWIFDGGNTSVWSQFFHDIKVPNALLSTYKFGMLGAGVAQAIGAAVAYPQRSVCCLIGDGAMGFHLQEIETAIRNAVRVIYVVFCDKQWGMVKMNQQFALRPVKTMIKKSLPEEETINADLGEIEFHKVGEAMGAHGERVSKVEELRPALARCVAAERTSVIHVDVDPVTHMWAPGLLAFKDMHLEPKG